MSTIRTFLEYILTALMVIVPIYLLFSVRLQVSDNVVSGIVYNNQNNSIFAGKSLYHRFLEDGHLMIGSGNVN